jgi:hypothetical protein
MVWRGNAEIARQVESIDDEYVRPTRSGRAHSWLDDRSDEPPEAGRVVTGKRVYAGLTVPQPRTCRHRDDRLIFAVRRRRAIALATPRSRRSPAPDDWFATNAIARSRPARTSAMATPRSRRSPAPDDRNATLAIARTTGPASASGRVSPTSGRLPRLARKGGRTADAGLRQLLGVSGKPMGPGLRVSAGCTCAPSLPAHNGRTVASS